MVAGAAFALNAAWGGPEISSSQLNVQTFDYFNFTPSLAQLTPFPPLIISSGPGSECADDDGGLPIRAVGHTRTIH